VKDTAAALTKRQRNTRQARTVGILTGDPASPDRVWLRANRGDRLRGTIADRKKNYRGSDGIHRRSRGAFEARCYLRAAQAYMLISMPTGTSTIFGAFQAIRDLPSISQSSTDQSFERDVAPGET
jgi:hypothetical protein